MSAGQWTLWLAVAGALIVAGVYRIRKHGRAEGGEITPLNDLMDGPAEQVGDDTLSMVADMWDSFEEANVHGIEVDDTAAEADMVPYSVVAANGPEVMAHGRALVAAIDAWRRDTDLEAWLGERGWL